MNTFMILIIINFILSILTVFPLIYLIRNTFKDLRKVKTNPEKVIGYALLAIFGFLLFTSLFNIVSYGLSIFDIGSIELAHEYRSGRSFLLQLSIFLMSLGFIAIQKNRI